MTSELLIGVDGGGSKTVALLAGRAGQLLGRGRAGPSNYHSVGAERACAELQQAIASAFDAARIIPRPPAAICLGLAGVDRPEDRALFQNWAAYEWPGIPVIVVADAELVLHAGTPEGRGVAIIAGAGSIVYGRSRAGKLARAGGWGYLLGDEGSGYAVGLAALRAVARAADGRGPPTMLTDLILGRWSLPAPQTLIRRVYAPETSRAEIAALADLVVSAASRADDVARQLLDDAIHELALAAEVVAGQLELSAPVPCAVAGGFIVNHPGIAAGVGEVAAARGLKLDPVTSVPEPAIGALQLARRLAAGG